MLELIIWGVNFISAVLSVIAWIKKSELKFYAITGLILGLISVATTQFTVVSLIFLFLFCIIVILIYSVKIAAKYETEYTKAMVLFNNKSKDDVKQLIESIFNPPIYNLTETARAVSFAASKGIEFEEISDLILISGKLSIAVQSEFIDAVDILIKLKRGFDFEGSYEFIADKITVTAQSGVPLHELLLATNIYFTECSMPGIIKLDEYLASACVLCKKEIRGIALGKDLAALINELIDNKDELMNCLKAKNNGV